MFSEYCTSGVDLYPAGPAGGVTVTASSTTNTYGSWTEIVASTGANVYICAVAISTADTSGRYSQVAIGTGGAGSETTVAVVKMASPTASFGAVVPIIPPVQISSGTRIAARVACGIASISHLITLQYIPVASVANPVLAEVTNPTAAVVSDAGNTATTFKTNLSETATDYWKDCFVKITSGALTNQVKRITAYNGSTKFITVSGAFTGTPAASVTFELINQ